MSPALNATGNLLDAPRLIVPTPDAEPWPTLGPEVCDFIEDNLVHGPGDILGEPVTLTDEVRLFIYRMYEVFPRHHPRAGRRRFKRSVFSRRKGVGKTEIAAWLAIAEMDPQAPMRCDGWRQEGDVWVPVGRPVHDPYIPMVAVTEEQTEDLAYGAVYAILERCELGNDYDIGLERIMHKRAPGKIQPLASAPKSRDGARTTFQHFDETHLFVEERLKNAHATMGRNIPKRYYADAHSLETTTMYGPGEGSIAEGSHRFATEVLKGDAKDASLLFDHRGASETHNIKTDSGLRAAIKEASGDAWAFADVDAIVMGFHDPQNHENEQRRYWLNQRRKGKTKWLDPALLEKCADPTRTWEAIAEGTPIICMFDGSYNRDSTALVGCTIEERPHVFLIAAWEKPINGGRGWRVKRNRVEDKIDWTLKRWQVLEMDCDPYGWGREYDDWEDAYGSPPIVLFETKQAARMGPACDDFFQAVADQELTYDGSEVITRHISNAVEEERRGYKVITKSEPDSPDKIDAAVGAVVSHHRAKHAGAGGYLWMED